MPKGGWDVVVRVSSLVLEQVLLDWGAHFGPRAHLLLLLQQQMQVAFDFVDHVCVSAKSVQVTLSLNETPLERCLDDLSLLQ